MLMIGTNNTGTNTAPEIAEGIGAVVLEMRHDFPDAKILLLAIFPRSTPGDPVRDKIAEVNRVIAKLDDQKHVFYMDIGAKFLDEQGAFLPNAFRADNLHPQAKGYDIWGEAVQARLAVLALRAGVGSQGEPEAELARKFLDSVAALNRSFGIPSHLGALREDDIPELAKAACREADTNYPVPRVMSQEACEALLREVLPEARKRRLPPRPRPTLTKASARKAPVRR
jgi:hypothetical protein